METKYCSKCQQHKPITEFYKNNRWCKKCVRAYQKKYYEEHYAPEKITDLEGFRTCSICKELKPVSEYYRDRSNVSGYSHRCKKCGDALREARRQKKKEAKAALKEIIPDGFKKCSKCKEVLLLSEFNLLKSGPNAGKYQSQCRNCRKLYRQENREKIGEQRRSYKQRPEVKERVNTKRRFRRQTDLELIAKEKASRKEYQKREYVKIKKREHGVNYRSRPENQAKARRRTIEWRNANHEKANHHSRIKRWLKKNSEGSFDYDQWITMLAFYKGYCPRCGEAKELTHDHIIPVSWGGTSWINNIQCLCFSCNTAKGNHHATDYRPPAVKAWADSEMVAAGIPIEWGTTPTPIRQLPFDPA